MVLPVGIQLALSEGIQNLIVELDARVVIDLINSNVDTVKPYSPLSCDCRCLLRRFPQVQVKHVYREGNRCADALASWGCLMDDAFVVFSSPPNTDVLYLVNSDLAGMHVNRIVNTGLTSSVG
ncbi:hypothetical protein SO802_003916 [Lithocarpus litseifolius]|uniref:RNase H type-1 domain-containing protein n=1 Tax=Lithocarpus litseifolius TaxID=425828 RepID=A0AAW2E419_9ROSI